MDKGESMKKFINRIIKLFGRKKGLKPTPKQSADNMMIQKALQKLEGFKEDTWQRIVLDNKYWTCSKEAFQEIIDYNTLNEKQYVSEQYDCDNFAFTFKAQVGLNHNLNNVGLVIDNSGGHAYNVVIFDDGTAELFEPQNDRWITPGESGAYTFQTGIIIL